jgi:hypothetical protein
LKSLINKSLRLLAVFTLCAGISGCDDPQVYGSIGVSSYGGGGYYGSPRVGGSISIGGRIR